MAKTRVSELAKEFGMSSKDMLKYLREMMIPAKTSSSTLESAYVGMVRKKLKPILAAKAAEIESAKAAANEAAQAAKKKAAEEAEQQRLAAEERREKERLAAQEARQREEEARQRVEAQKAAEEAARKAAEEAARPKDNAPKFTTSFTSLLDQIAKQEQVLKQHAEQEATKKKKVRESGGRKGNRSASGSRSGAGARTAGGSQTKSRHGASTGEVAFRQGATVEFDGRDEHGERSERAGRGERGERAGRSERAGRGERGERAGRDGHGERSERAGRGERIGHGERGERIELPGDSEGRGVRKGRRGRKGSGREDGDRYSRMARAAEEYNREHVLEEARQAIAEAAEESQGRRRRRKERRKQQQAEAEREAVIADAIKNDQDLSQLDTVSVPTGSTVAQLSELIGVPANDIIKRLFLLGTPLTMTQTMSDDLIELVADDLGVRVKVMTKEEENSFTFYDDPASLKPRPPVVTVMGHVDHGKTSLLDAIRHTGVAAGEAGGITQAIGASKVWIGDRQITFIDTPGHATFTAMRARGAKVTDIVILIVAADDGVMPQTIESINHAKAASVPIIVAVNKIDKPGADPTRVRQELTEYGLIPEEWGGQTMFCDISAKKHIGIDNLLESVLLEADILELVANPDTFASGYVLEAKLDRGRGSVATLLVNRGTLHVGDTIVAGLAYGRVRAMLDPHGINVKEAKPSDPVEILGLQSVPMAGDEFRVFTDERDARALATERSLKARIEEQSKVKHVTLENLFATMADAEVKELNLIIKADVQGSIEALQDSLDKMDQSEVRINTIHSAVGAINETDVTLADASNAIIIGFGVRPEAKARAAAEQAGVEIRTYSVIYKAIEDIDAARIGMLKPTEQEIQTGMAEVRNTFKVPKVGIAAGCMVQEGEISVDDRARLVRDGVTVWEGQLASLRRFKDDVKSVKAGFECGIGLAGYQDIHVGDQIECYRIEEVTRTE